MAYPLAAIGLIASAAGAAAGAAGNKASADAMERERAAAALRQKKFQEQAQTAVDTSVSKSGADTAEKDMEKGAAERLAIQDQLRAALPVEGAAENAATGENTVVAETPLDAARTNTRTATSAWGKLTGGAAARLGAYDDWRTNRAVDNAEATQKIGVASNLARGEAATLPARLESAGHAGDTLGGIGQVLSAIGAVASMGSAVGAGAGAAAPAGTTVGVNAAGQAASFAPGAMGNLSASFAPAGTAANAAWTSAFAPASSWLSTVGQVANRLNPWQSAFAGWTKKKKSFI